MYYTVGRLTSIALSLVLIYKVARSLWTMRHSRGIYGSRTSRLFYYFLVLAMIQAVIAILLDFGRMVLQEETPRTPVYICCFIAKYALTNICVALLLRLFTKRAPRKNSIHAMVLAFGLSATIPQLIMLLPYVYAVEGVEIIVAQVSFFSPMSVAFHPSHLSHLSHLAHRSPLTILSPLSLSRIFSPLPHLLAPGPSRELHSRCGAWYPLFHVRPSQKTEARQHHTALEQHHIA
jgi:hypothetical protein